MHSNLGDVSLHVRWGGEGPAVVCPDLRGHGRSTLPLDQPEHAQYSKRPIAGDVVASGIAFAPDIGESVHSSRATRR